VIVSVYQFGDFGLDCARFERSLDGRAIKLERKPVELLILLAIWSTQTRAIGR
jgi:hypothetical protein